MLVRIDAIKMSTNSKCWKGCREKCKTFLTQCKNPLTLLVGMQTSTATMENNVEMP